MKLTGTWLEQGRHAAAVAQRHHELLIAHGFEWDGMDGYTYCGEDFADLTNRLWKQAIEECKGDS